MGRKRTKRGKLTVPCRRVSRRGPGRNIVKANQILLFRGEEGRKGGGPRKKKQVKKSMAGKLKRINEDSGINKNGKELKIGKKGGKKTGHYIKKVLEHVAWRESICHGKTKENMKNEKG